MLMNLIHDIIVYNILIPFIINSAPTFKDALQPIINLSVTNKYFKMLLEESNHKTNMYNALLKDKKTIDMLNNITTAQEAQQILLKISKNSGLFLNQYPKRSSQDFSYMNKFVVALLKQKGARVNSVNNRTTSYNSPLFIAIEHHNNPYFVEALLAHKAFPNQRNEHGSTPLMIARKSGKNDAYNVLIEYGAKKNAKDIYGNTVHSDIYAPCH